MEETERKILLGKRIKELRLQQGLSQSELAEKVGKTSPAYIAFIEAGERNISTMDLMVLAKQLGTKVSELVGETKQGQKPEFLEALRSSSGLSKEERNKIEDYYEFLRQKQSKKNGR